ncbi:arylsulfatase [soil metagenome]
MKNPVLIVALAASLSGAPAPAADPARPNIVFIMADDLGFGELGCFGNEKILTPNLDQMAAEGMRLTNFYAGATVCAPSRCVLMTGKHTGRCTVRGNAGGGAESIQTLKDSDLTVAEILKGAGYQTALSGKWGLGELGSSGRPTAQGFDHFFGYLNQHHAHNYYPPFLIRNEVVVALENDVHPEWQKARSDRHEGGGFSLNKAQYSHDLVIEDALAWVGATSRDQPFFLYLALTIPHANNEAGRVLGDGQEVPEYGPYADKDWSNPNKGQAAMITRMDRDIGRLFDQIEAMGIDEDTLVVFTSDNGHHREGGNDPELFDANGPLRGMKRDLYEGGIRVPTIARWPGMIDAGTVSDHVAYFGDLLATACELSGAAIPDDDDLWTTSFLPTLTGHPDAQREHPYLYWAFYEQGGKEAVRFGDWKAVRMPIGNGDLELYNLATDLGEANDIAGDHPEAVEKAKQFMQNAFRDDPNWQPRGSAPNPPEPGDGRMRF